ncbi:MAG TPA: energy transducer TonB [Flavobacteriales bacterium]|nr:energy transducer TonB [Flavobacteriales bacterium]
MPPIHLNRSLSFASSLVVFATFLLGGCKGSSETVAMAPADCCQRERDVYEVPELTKAPEFPGGEPAMYAWLGNKLTHPASAEGVEGTAWVQFNVACDGKLQGIFVKVPLHPDLDSVAVRAVRDMPDWTPGKIKERVVCTRYALPVRFE